MFPGDFMWPIPAIATAEATALRMDHQGFALSGHLGAEVAHGQASGERAVRLY